MSFYIYPELIRQHIQRHKAYVVTCILVFSARVAEAHYYEHFYSSMHTNMPSYALHMGDIAVCFLTVTL